MKVNKIFSGLDSSKKIFELATLSFLCKMNDNHQKYLPLFNNNGSA